VKFKLDENIGAAGTAILNGFGHEVSTVREQQLVGVADNLLLEACVREERSLVTLDRGIGRTFLLSGSNAMGVVVLDIGAPQRRDLLLARLHQLAGLLENHELAGSVWILEAHRVRMHQAG